MDNTPIPDAPDFSRRWINLADPRLGAAVLSASDEFFAPRERLLQAGSPVFIPGKYDDHGKWMDGWETRRKRHSGHDHCVVKLGLPGVIKGIDIDTRHFTGNFPPAAQLEGALCDGVPDAATRWVALTAPISLQGNRQHFVAIDNPHSWSHVRLNIYPDGGVARLRVYGQVSCDWTARSPDHTYDLIALENGGRMLACNDAHFGSPNNLLMPGCGLNMGDGWETRRRREPGNDWAIIALGHAGVITRIEVDTAFFKGNYPDRCSIQAAWVVGGTEQSIITQSLFWPTLLAEQPLSMDAVHSYAEAVQALGPVTHIRFNIFPDGGVSRLRLHGQMAALP
jgi:allantoicase